MRRRRTRSPLQSPASDVQTLLSMLAYQDSLLQTYRSVHFTFQSIVVAIAGAVTGNALQSPPTIQFIFYWLVILAMFVASIYFGRLTQGLIDSTGKDVSCLQSMLKAVEMSSYIDGSSSQPHYTIWQEMRNPFKALADDQLIKPQLRSFYDFYQKDGFGDIRVTNGFFKPDYSTGGWGERGAREKWRQLMVVWTNWIWFILLFTLSVKSINEAITVSESLSGSGVMTPSLVEHFTVVTMSSAWHPYFPSPTLFSSVDGIHAAIIFATLALPVFGLLLLVTVAFAFYTQFATIIWKGRSPRSFLDFSLWKDIFSDTWRDLNTFWNSFPVSLTLFPLVFFITVLFHPFHTAWLYYLKEQGRAR